jgi:hypothetical protein
VTTPCGQGGPVGPAIGVGCWDEVKGIILARLRLGAPKEMGRGECVQVGLTEVFTLWGRNVSHTPSDGVCAKTGLGRNWGQ